MNFQIQSWPSPEIFIAALRKAFTKTFFSTPQVWTNNVVVPHGFGSRPSCSGAFIDCIVAEGGYNAGDFVNAADVTDINSTTPACAIMQNSANLVLNTTDTVTGGNLAVVVNGGGTPFTITAGNWRITFWAIQF